MSRINILLTSVGRRVELVKAFRRAFSKTGLQGTILATDIDPLAPALREVDVPIIVPRNKDPEFVPAIARICTEHEVTAVFPLIDPDIPVLADNREEIESAGTKVAVVGSKAALTCGDKWYANEFFRDIGIACPRSWRPGDNIGQEFPMFIKPRGGSAAEHTYKINNVAELEFFTNYVRNPIVQEFLPGPEITSDIICDLEGRVISIVSRQRIAVRGGEVIKGFTMHDDRIYDACESIAKSLPAIGPITAQCMMKDGIPHFIEVNARLGGGIPLAIAAGVDVPAILLRSISGEVLRQMEPGAYTHGLHLTRFDQSFFADGPSIVKNPSHHI